jgi:hypothetical protein
MGIAATESVSLCEQMKADCVSRTRISGQNMCLDHVARFIVKAKHGMM